VTAHQVLLFIEHGIEVAMQQLPTIKFVA
jgi:hypothetical protein